MIPNHVITRSLKLRKFRFDGLQESERLFLLGLIGLILQVTQLSQESDLLFIHQGDAFLHLPQRFPVVPRPPLLAISIVKISHQAKAQRSLFLSFLRQYASDQQGRRPL